MLKEGGVFTIALIVAFLPSLAQDRALPDRAPVQVSVRGEFIAPSATTPYIGHWYPGDGSSACWWRGKRSRPVKRALGSPRLRPRRNRRRVDGEGRVRSASDGNNAFSAVVRARLGVQVGMLVVAARRFVGARNG